MARRRTATNAAVARDVALGYVSAEARTADYGGPALAGGAGMSGKMIGVDVGGTFTDVFVLDEATGTAPWSPRCRPRARTSRAASWTASRSEVATCRTVSTVVHGTTAGTNALLERKGAKIGVITTRGFRDVLEMRRRDRPRTWGLRGDFEPVVPRNLRLEVPERTLADGT